MASAIGKMSHLPHTTNHREARRERKEIYTGKTDGKMKVLWTNIGIKMRHLSLLSIIYYPLARIDNLK